jgi:hypothetical protein
MLFPDTSKEREMQQEMTHQAPVKLIRKAAFGLVVCSVLTLANLGLTGHAEARITGVRNTPLKVLCGNLQDQWDSQDLKERVARATGENAAASKANLIKERIEQSWFNNGCFHAFYKVAPATEDEDARLNLGPGG